MTVLFHPAREGFPASVSFSRPFTQFVEYGQKVWYLGEAYTFVGVDGDMADQGILGYEEENGQKTMISRPLVDIETNEYLATKVFPSDAR